MKRSRGTLGLLTVAVALAAGSMAATAQSGPQGNQEQQRNGAVVPTQPQQGSLEGPAANQNQPSEAVPQPTRDRLQEFGQAREEYLARLRELTHQMRGSSDAAREQLREQIREQHQAWLEEVNRIREQARERMQKMKDELLNHREMIDEIRERTREQGRERLRERRGTD